MSYLGQEYADRKATPWVQEKKPGETYNVVPDEEYHDEMYGQSHVTSEMLGELYDDGGELKHDGDPRAPKKKHRRVQ